MLTEFIPFHIWEKKKDQQIVSSWSYQNTGDVSHMIHDVAFYDSFYSSETTASDRYLERFTSSNPIAITFSFFDLGLQHAKDISCSTYMPFLLLLDYVINCTYLFFRYFKETLIQIQWFPICFSSISRLVLWESCQRPGMLISLWE